MTQRKLPLIRGAILIWFHHWLSRRDWRKKEEWKAARYYSAKRICRACKGRGRVWRKTAWSEGYRPCSACGMTGHV